jgi:GGDEF domain-containing protein
MDVFTGYLRELLAAPPGAEFDFTWDTNGQHFTMTLCYSRQAGVANWKLYRGKETKTQLVWEHLTNDIPLLYNLVVSQTGSGDSTCDADLALALQHGELTSPGSKAGSYMVRNLQKLFVEAQTDLVRKNKTDEDAPNDSKEIPNIQNWGPENVVQQEAGAPAAVNIEFQPNVSPHSAHTVDLTRGRGLLQSLLINEMGVLSFPAFLFLLEQEYYKALTSNAPLTVVLFRISGLARDDGSCYQGPLPRPAVQTALQQLRAGLRRTDMIAEYEGGCFIFLLPDTEITGAKLFARKISRFFSNPSLLPGPGNAGMKVSFGLATLGEKLKTLPILLGGAEQALSAAEATDCTVVTYDDYVESVSNPWQDMSQNATLVAPRKGINLDPMRNLLSQLRAEDLGIFTYAAWLVFLEREYHRSIRQRRILLSMIVRMRLHDITASNPSNMLPQEAVREAFRRIGQMQRKGDIIGHFTHGNFAVLRPACSIKGMEQLARQIKKTLMERPLSNDFDHNDLRIGIQICAVRGNSSFPDALMFHQVEATGS